VDNTRSFSFNGSFEIDNVWTVGGRIGYLVHPQFLLYGLAGYSQLEMDGNLGVVINEPGRAPHALALAVDDHLDGYTLGAGGELGLHRNLSLKVEYRFSQFDGSNVGVSQPIFIAGCQCVFADSASAKIDDIDEHSVRAALVLRFGDRDRHPVEPLK
jgi:opacity protein-like surface antigen